MAFKQLMLVLMVPAWLVAGQRPSFAGSRPIGYPEVASPSDALGNRFGDDSPLPVEAKGDRALVERLSKLPIDKQPFWFINWKAIEENRKNPQTYPQRENSFTNQGNSGQPQSTNFQTNPPNTQSNSGANSELTSKFGETNNGANVNFASNPAGNFASTSNSNGYQPYQGYNNHQTRGYFSSDNNNGWQWH